MAAAGGVMFRCHCGQQFSTQLDRIEHKIDANHRTEEKHVEELDNDLTNLEAGQATIQSKLTVLDADEQRELADLEAKPQDQLNDDERTRIAALLTKQADLAAQVQADDDAINAADPAPVVTPPADGAPVDETPVDDGSGDTPPADGSGDTAPTE